jgi:hypothetical protein
MMIQTVAALIVLARPMTATHGPAKARWTRLKGFP